MRKLIGLTFLALGVIAGIVLLLAPFGKSPLAAGPLMWFTFPIGCVIGHVSLMVGADRAQMGLHSTIVGGTLLLLGLIATVAQFLVSGGVLAAAERHLLAVVCRQRRFRARRRGLCAARHRQGFRSAGLTCAACTSSPSCTTAPATRG